MDPTPTTPCLRARGYSIQLKDIENVDIETRIADVTKIKISLKNKTEYIDFARQTTGHTFSILFGDTGWIQSEVSSYTAYWASLITMAKFLFGKSDEVEEIMEEVSCTHSKDMQTWCADCAKYVIVPWTDTSVRKIVCPECGRKGMTTLSPDDMQAWCRHCVKYVIVPRTDTPVWKLICPECGRKGMVSKSLEDRKKHENHA